MTRLEETEITPEFKAEMDGYREKPEGKGLIEACSENIILFAEHMLGVKPYTWEIDFLRRIQDAADGVHWTKEIVALTSRQIGKSTSLAIAAIWLALFNKYSGTVHNHTLVGCISASDTQAKKLLYEMKKLMNMGDGFMLRTYKDEDDTPIFGKHYFTDCLAEDAPNNTTTISFKPHNPNVHGKYLLAGSLSGSIIQSYPPTSVVLGETFTVLIEDEAGKNDKITDQFHYDYAAPTGDAWDAIRIYTSTPWSPAGFFYRMADPEGEYDKHPADRILYTIEAIKEDAPKQYEIVKNKIDVMNQDGKTDEVQRAYYCRFVKGESNYFNPDRVRDMFNEEQAMVLASTLKCDMGVDFGGQVKSKTVITITHMDDEGIIHRLFDKVYEVGQDLSLIDDIEMLRKDFNVQRIIPDDCPAGDFLIRTMREKGWDIEPMNFRSDKIKKYSAFRASLNRGQIKSYPDDVLKTEMLALENTQGQRQSTIQAPKGYSDDRIDSFVMSAYFMVQEEDTVKTFDYYGGEGDGSIFERVGLRRRGN